MSLFPSPSKHNTAALNFAVERQNRCDEDPSGVQQSFLPLVKSGKMNSFTATKEWLDYISTPRIYVLLLLGATPQCSISILLFIDIYGML